MQDGGSDVRLPTYQDFVSSTSLSVRSFLKYVASKRQKPRKSVTRVYVVLDHIESKIVEATEGPHSNYYQKCHAERGVLGEQENCRKQP